MKYYYSIDQLAIDDAQWRKLAFILAKDRELADEILHTLYMKLFKRIENSDVSFRVNKNYMYTGLVNCLNDYYNFKNKHVKFEYQHVSLDDKYDIEIDKHNELLAGEVLDNANELKWFDRKLFQLIVYEKKISIRQLSRQSGINYNTIQKSIIKSKEYLKNKHDQNGKI